MNNAQQFENFERLKQEQQKFLSSCDEKIQKWQKFKNDYIALKTRLETLPHELKYEIMVPISKLGFMPGRLVKTNEILVLLGDNWFVERSAKQACEIIDRRIANCDKYLDGLLKEKNVLTDQANWTDNLLQEKGEFVNIEEKLDDSNKSQIISKSNELTKASASSSSSSSSSTKKQLTEEEKKELRRKQQERALNLQMKINEQIRLENEKLHGRSLKVEEPEPDGQKNNAKVTEENEDEDEDDDEEEDKDLSKNGNVESDKDVANFLEQLSKDIENLDFGRKFEIEEEIKSEENKSTTKTSLKNIPNQSFEDMLKEYEKSIDRKNNELMQKVLKPDIETMRISDPDKKTVKWSDENKDEDEDEDEVEGEDENKKRREEDEEEEETEEEEEDDDEEEEEEIEETTRLKPHVIKIKHTKDEKLDEIERNRALSRDKTQIDSPGDIYKVFYKPKSILKTKSSLEESSKTQSYSNVGVANVGVSSNGMVSWSDDYNQKTYDQQTIKESQKDEPFKFEREKAFTGEIVERVPIIKPQDSRTEDTETKRPISRFKASKQK